MKWACSTFKFTRRAAAALSLTMAVSGAAFAGTIGSTDIYRNEFPRSIDPVAALTPASASAYRNGSTDIYSNPFAQSFPTATLGAFSVGRLASCESGSTDIYRADFQKIFATKKDTHLASCP
jgi:hypothetical protein